jgi:FdrA protein
MVGTDEDPQDLDEQVAMLEAAGAWVSTSNEAAVRYAGGLLGAEPAVAAAAKPAAETGDERGRMAAPGEGGAGQPVALEVLRRPLAAINAGLASFAESLAAQDAAVVHVDWRPPAGGDERLMAILARMKGS